jgi:hypothetical protein
MQRQRQQDQMKALQLLTYQYLGAVVAVAKTGIRLLPLMNRAGRLQVLSVL